MLFFPALLRDVKASHGCQVRIGYTATFFRLRPELGVFPFALGCLYFEVKFPSICIPQR